MSISISPTGQTQTSYQGIRPQVTKDVQDLTSALQSGDLQTAQTSYADLQKLLQSRGAISASTSTNPVLTDFQALGKDLASGDLSSAQEDLTQLQTGATQQAGGPNHRHHHHHHAESNETSSTSSPAVVPTGISTA